MRYNPNGTAVHMRYTCETLWFLASAGKFLNLNGLWLVLICLGAFLPWFPLTISESPLLGRQRAPVTLGLPGNLAPRRLSSSRIAACQLFPGERWAPATEPTSCWTCVLHRRRIFDGYTMIHIYNHTHMYRYIIISIRMHNI